MKTLLSHHNSFLNKLCLIYTSKVNVGKLHMSKSVKEEWDVKFFPNVIF